MQCRRSLFCKRGGFATLPLCRNLPPLLKAALVRQMQFLSHRSSLVSRHFAHWVVKITTTRKAANLLRDDGRAKKLVSYPYSLCEKGLNVSLESSLDISQECSCLGAAVIDD